MRSLRLTGRLRKQRHTGSSHLVADPECVSFPTANSCADSPRIRAHPEGRAGARCARSVFHRDTAGVWKLRLIGTKPGADLAGERVKLQVLRCAAWQVSSLSCAYLHATQQAFLEAQ